MNEASKKVLDEILAKGAGTLNEYEVSILRARRSYLTAEQEEKFADVLKVEEEIVPLDEMKFTELKELCAQRKIDVPTTVKSKDAILALIAEAEKAADQLEK
ncbi:MAG: hypothetical protein WC823_00215 [Parcubacteria group bacterium]|jgi:hypothetical protein